MTDKTIVIFRKFRDDDSIIALFPMEPWSHSPYTCSSYMSTGQHGAACPTLINETAPASPDLYEALHHELETLGYKLDIRKRTPINAIGVRQQVIKEMQA